MRGIVIAVNGVIGEEANPLVSSTHTLPTVSCCLTTFCKMQEISNTTFSFVVESIKRKENRTTESNMRVVRYTNVRR